MHKKLLPVPHTVTLKTNFVGFRLPFFIYSRIPIIILLNLLAIDLANAAPAISETLTSPAVKLVNLEDENSAFDSAPLTPKGITAYAGDEIIRISWEKSAKAILYKIYAAAEPGVTPDNYKQLKQGANYVSFDPHYLVTDLDRNKAYYFIVTAENSLGESLPSAQITATTKPLFDKPQKSAIIPSPPSNLAVQSESDQILLKWDNVKNADRYNIYFASERGVGKSRFKQLKNGMAVYNAVNPFVYKGLEKNTKYYFVVSAENQAGESMVSSEISIEPAGSPETRIAAVQKQSVRQTNKAKPPQINKNKTRLKTQNPLTRKPTGPPPPPPETLVTNHNNSLILSWMDAPGAKEYNLYVANESGLDRHNYGFLKNGLVYQSVKSPFQINKPAPGETYFFIVTSVNDNGESNSSGEKSIRIRGAQPPLPENIAMLRSHAMTLADTQSKALTSKFLGIKNEIRKSSLYLTLNKNGSPIKDQTVVYSRHPWSCVQSKSTGLVWEVKTDDGGLRDRNNTYTWFNPDNTTNGGNSGVANGGNCNGSQCDTLAYVDAINRIQLCGFNDWRLPTREELTTLIDPKVPSPNPAIDSQSFPHISGSYHWTDSPHANDAQSAWFVSFQSGHDQVIQKSSPSHVILVRGYPKPVSAILSLE